jgi:energy-coupling factor transporter ATP-binding protein EcfA2
MIKEYSQNRNNVIMNFSLKYCSTQEQLLNSQGFKKVLTKYTQNLEKKETVLYDDLLKICDNQNITKVMTELFKLLLSFQKREIYHINETYKHLLKNEDILFHFIEGLYNYWRSLERYALIQNNTSSAGIQNTNFIEANNAFTDLILSTYRQIEENVLEMKHSVYRQLHAGINAGLVLTEWNNTLPEEYNNLNDISFIKSVIFTPPYVMYPKKNKRSGLFEEVYENPIKDLPINKSHFFVYPAKVGDSLAFVYFHRDFMNHGVALCNLFELAKPEEYQYKTPDLVYVFGQRIKNNKKKTVFYHDQPNDIYVGFASNSDEIDYFGYMKKMILTLHNVRMINQNALPIHGAMTSITLKNGKKANVAIMGDSGAGKSESLEAFRKLSDKYLKEMKIIFDDMGTFKIENGKVYGYGTEIGAFVRLDDLEDGYAFQAIDRGIFMNPHKQNSRLLYPVSTYNEIMQGYKVDIFLYANNYSNKRDAIHLFNNIEDAITTFKNGTRKAKGTTTEEGLVDSYFANPFGVVQRKNQSDTLIQKTFEALYKNNVEVGEIYTKLAIPGKEQTGPKSAASWLFEWIMDK